jgi:hypothetical protein
MKENMTGELKDNTTPFMPCPFVYANGKKCGGYIKQVEFIKCGVVFTLNQNGDIISVGVETPRYHVHLYCSEKEGHGGIRGHSEQMKVWYDDLPKELVEKIDNLI